MRIAHVLMKLYNVYGIIRLFAKLQFTIPSLWLLTWFMEFTKILLILTSYYHNHFNSSSSPSAYASLQVSSILFFDQFLLMIAQFEYDFDVKRNPLLFRTIRPQMVKKSQIARNIKFALL